MAFVMGGKCVDFRTVGEGDARCITCKVRFH